MGLRLGFGFGLGFGIGFGFGIGVGFANLGELVHRGAADDGGAHLVRVGVRVRIRARVRIRVRVFGLADDGGAHEGAAVAVRDGELRGGDAVLLGHGHVGVHRRGPLR